VFNYTWQYLLETNHSAIEGQPSLVRGFGLLEATALNMSNMVGVGPFITIPLIIASMGGPQCMLGWLLGAVLALCDGLVWSELAAAMPGTGGSYLYLREAFRRTRVGGLLPFLFIWQFVLSGPLEIGSGCIGFAQYVGYFWRGMTAGQGRWIAIGVGALAILLLYRRITAIGRLTVVLWVGMLATVAWIIAAGIANFHAAVVFDFPPNAFTFSRGFAAGLGSAMLIAMYDFMGYYDICYVGGEVRNPERVIPRSIIYSVLAVAVIYLLCNLSIIAVVPWREAIKSKFIASEFIERLYGTRAAGAVTLLVLWTALASVFALLLGYSRIPYAAAFLQDFCPAPSHRPISARRATGNGRACDGRQPVRSRRSDLRAADVADFDSVHRPNFRGALLAPEPRPRPAVQNVAVSASQHHCLHRLVVHFSDVGMELCRLRIADAGGGLRGLLGVETRGQNCVNRIT
jgi:amino acid transporter